MPDAFRLSAVRAVYSDAVSRAHRRDKPDKPQSSACADMRGNT